MTTIPLFDCDNHIYEPPDAATRFLPEEYLNRAITPITLANGEQGLLAGGRLVTGLDHPIDMAHQPGALKIMLREMKSGKPTEAYKLQPLRPEYLEREPRLALMDEQGIESAILYPATMGTMAEHYVHGIKPLYANLHSYNQWLNETWGFDYQSRIYTPAVLSLRDLDSAVEELDFVLVARREVHHAQRRTGLRSFARRSLLRPVLGPDQRGARPASPITSASSGTTRTSRRRGATTPSPCSSR